jgi:hypothetical protein
MCLTQHAVVRRCRAGHVPCDEIGQRDPAKTKAGAKQEVAAIKHGKLVE